MSLISFGGIPQRMAQNIYYKTKTNANGEEYVLSPSRKEAWIQRLEDLLDKGEITQAEYERQVAAIKKAPKVVSVDKNENIHKNSRLKSSDSLPHNNEENQKSEMEKLKKLYENGDISDFAYKANMYLLTAPSPAMEQSSSFSVTA